MANKPTGGAARPGGPKQSRIKQIGALAKVMHQANPKALPIVFAAAIGTLVVAVVIGLLLDQLLFLVPLGIMAAVLVAMIVFGQLAQRTQYKMIAGQPGAAASVLDNMRGGWTVTPAVAGNRSLDLVHRAVGRPGVLLVSEGPSARVAPLLNAERKRLSRAAAQVPIYAIQVGDEEGQVPIGKLQRHIMKLPRNLNKAQLGELNDRLRALPATMQMPKGPMPRGARMPKGPKPKTR